MARVRFLMIAGFLGAGKTTTLARLARHYMESGKRVAIVTNDQAYDLVDTESLRAQGFDVGEVPGACFCCKFDELLATASRLTAENAPDIVLAEPVGSCTDLVATVIEPLRHLHGDEYEVGPLAVLFKPEHGRKILGGRGRLGFSPKAAYIFLKQLEEADAIVLNKVDKLSADERHELLQLVENRFPQKRVLLLSARSGEGLTALVDVLDTASHSHETLMNVDYDVYAEGEAELGWLNCQIHVASLEGRAFSLDALVMALVQAMRAALLAQDAEPAHLKILCQSGDRAAIANLVGSDVDPELSLASEIESASAEVIVNARVAIDPLELETVVRRTVSTVAASLGLNATIRDMQRFRPGRPVPTHRLGAERALADVGE